ncbi:MAG: hypothetical protein WBE90_01090 [Xanthobacteraceae bacterium]
MAGRTERNGAAQLGPFAARRGLDERIGAQLRFQGAGLLMHHGVEHGLHFAGDAELEPADRQHDIDDIDLRGEIGRELPVRHDGRPRRRRHAAMNIGVLIDRLDCRR